MADLETNVERLANLYMQLSRSFQHRESEILQGMEADITLREWHVIFYLGSKCPCIMREIADRLKLAVSSVTGLVDRLVQKGLVVRERPEDDRRIVNVELTEKGREAYRWHFREHLNMFRAMLQTLDEQDQDTLIALFTKIIQGGQDHQPGSVPPSSCIYNP